MNRTARPHRCRRSASIALVTVAALCGIHRQVRAQSGSAEALYNEGHRLMNAGKLAQACETFEASNRAQPGAGTYLALGMCRERNHQLASAWSAYQAALGRAKDLEKRRFAYARIAELEPQLSYLTVSVSADSRVAGLTITRNGTVLDPLLWNRALPTDGGDYVIEGRAPGREPWRSTVHVPIERGKVIAVVPDVASQDKPPPPATLPPETPPPTTAPPTTAPTTTEVGWSARRKLAAGSAAASVVALAAGAILGFRARSDHNDAVKLCPLGPKYSCENADRANVLKDSANNLGIGADVAFGIAGVAAITAGVLWFGGRQDPGRGTAIVPAVSPGQFAVIAIRSF